MKLKGNESKLKIKKNRKHFIQSWLKYMGEEEPKLIVVKLIHQRLRDRFKKDLILSTFGKKKQTLNYNWKEKYLFPNREVKEKELNNRTGRSFLRYLFTDD